MEENQMRLPPPPPAAAAAAAAAAAMSSVLGDGDLLREILIRLDLPTNLLRAALVCKRWYRHASDPAFLDRFRDCHPPRVLGVYLCTVGQPRPRFFPICPHPDLAAAARRARSFFDDFLGFSVFVFDSRGGRLLVSIHDDDLDNHNMDLLCSPLFTTGNAVVVPPPPRPLFQNPSRPLGTYMSLPECGDGLSYLYAWMDLREQKTIVNLYELQDMCWVMRASAAAQLSVTPTRFTVMLFDHSKFYILTTGSKILVCDFQSSSISALELPIGVENDYDTQGIMLSRGGGSGIYLTHVKRSLLHVFQSDNAGNWFLVQSICLREVCANLGMADWPPLDGIKIRAVGDSAKFMFLEMFGTIVFLDATSKQAEKVHVMTPEDVGIDVDPLMLIWPPVFPQLKEGYCQ